MDSIGQCFGKETDSQARKTQVYPKSPPVYGRGTPIAVHGGGHPIKVYGEGRPIPYVSRSQSAHETGNRRPRQKRDWNDPFGFKAMASESDRSTQSEASDGLSAVGARNATPDRSWTAPGRMQQSREPRSLYQTAERLVQLRPMYRIDSVLAQEQERKRTLAADRVASREAERDRIFRETRRILSQPTTNDNDMVANYRARVKAFGSLY